MILKKMLKAALAASLVFGMASIGMAADGMNISGRVQSHWGQYTSGADGYKAWFKNTTQGHINVRATSGPMKYFMQIELEDDLNTKSEVTDANTVASDTDGDGQFDTNDNDTKARAVPGFSRSNLNNAQANATYTTGDLSVTIGTAVNWRSCGYTQDAGMGNTKSRETWVMCDTYKEQDGIDIDYRIAALKGNVSLTIFNTDATNITSIAAEVKPIDMLSVYVNSTTEVPTDAATGDTGETDTRLMLGLKATFGNMWAAADQSTITQPSATGGDDWTRTRLGLQFGMNGLGPGALTLTYGTRTDAAGDTLSTDAVTNAVYKVMVAKGANIRGFYTSKGTTPYVAGEAGDTTTSSFMGFGLELTM